MRKIIAFVMLLGLVCFSFLSFHSVNHWIERRYFPLFQHEIETMMGRPVTFESISCAWGPTLSLVAYGVEISDPLTGQTVARVRRIVREIEAGSLFQKSLKGRSLVLEGPVFSVVRGKDGSWEMPFAGAEFFTGSSLLKNFRIQDGRVEYREEFGDPPFRVTLSNLRTYVAKENLLVRADFSADVSSHGGLPVVATAVFRPGAKGVLLTLSLGQEKIMVEADVFWENQIPRFEGRVDVHQLPVEITEKSGESNRAGIAGLLTGSFEGTWQGSHPDHMLHSLAIQGVFDLRRGKFLHLNMIADVLKAMESLPGFESVQGLVPESVNGKDLEFDLLQGNLQVFKDRFYVHDLLVKHADYLQEAGGSFGIREKDVDFKARLVFLPSLSRVLARNEAFSALVNPHGRIMIPFSAEGAFPDISFQPDLDFIIGNLREAQAKPTLDRVAEALPQPEER